MWCHLCLTRSILANLAKIISLGGVDVIINAMSTHKDNGGVQENACWALSNLAIEDCMLKILHTLSSIHWWHVSVFNLAHGLFYWFYLFCFCLFVVSLIIAGLEKITSLGGIEMIIKAMSTHRDMIGVQVKACSALQNLACENGSMLLPHLCVFLYIFLQHCLIRSAV